MKVFKITSHRKNHQQHKKRKLVIGTFIVFLTGIILISIFNAVLPRQRLKYVALGDSLAAGLYASKQDKSYQYLVANYLQGKLHYDVTLNGKWETGKTVAEEALPNLSEIIAMKPDLVTIEFGTNEQNRDLPGYVSPAKFHANLAKLVKALKKSNPKMTIVLVTNWKSGTDAEYRSAYKRVAKRYHVQLVSLTDIWQDSRNIAPKGSKSWAGNADGYHPNDRGNKLIAQKINHTLAKVLPGGNWLARLLNFNLIRVPLLLIE